MFTTWLNSLSQQSKGPLILPPATRRLAYAQTLSLNGDFSAASFSANVKAAPDSATALAVFTVGAPIFSSGQTTVKLSLSSGVGANSTGILPSDTDFNGIETFIFDVLMTHDGVTDRLVAGLLPVSGFVTLPGA